MKRDTLKRIAIIGLPGSGKSTFAYELGIVMNIPVHHLDKYVFIGNVKKDHNEFISIQQNLVNQDSWIIEGCSLKTLEMRFARADVVIYFQFQRLLCIWRVIKRFFNYKKSGFDSGCTRIVNWALLKYIWTFDKEKGKAIEVLREQYPEVEFRIFNKSTDAIAYISELTPLK